MSAIGYGMDDRGSDSNYIEMIKFEMDWI